MEFFTTYDRATGEVRAYIAVSHLSELDAQIADDEGIIPGHLRGYATIDGDALPQQSDSSPPAPPAGFSVAE